MRYKYLLFDFDGTLAYSDEALYATVNDTLASHGHNPITRDEFEGYVGKKMRELYSKHAGGNEQIAESMKMTHLIAQKSHLHKYSLFPKVKSVLKELKDKGHKLALVTTANKIKINELLNTMKIRDLFSCCVMADDVKNVKPNREPFDKALFCLGALAKESIMIGDTDADVEGAKNAGLDSVGVTYSTFGKKIKEYNPTYTIDSFEELLVIIR